MGYYDDRGRRDDRDYRRSRDYDDRDYRRSRDYDDDRDYRRSRDYDDRDYRRSRDYDDRDYRDTRDYDDRGYDKRRDGYDPDYERKSDKKSDRELKKYARNSMDKGDADLAERSTFQTILCFLQGLVSIAALGVVTYLALMTSLFMTEEGMSITFAPFDFIAGQYAVITEFGNILNAVIDLFTNFMDGSLADNTAFAIFYISIALFYVALAVAVVTGVIKFLVGMFSKKYFSLNGSVALVFGGYVLLYITGIFTIGIDIFVNNMNSGVLRGLIITGAALAFGFICNIIYCPRFFARFKSFWKILMAIGAGGGVFMLVWYFPYLLNVFNETTGVVEATKNAVVPLMDAVKSVLEMAAGTETVPADLLGALSSIFTDFLPAMLGGLGTVIMLYLIPVSCYIQAKRISVCFSHKPKKEKSGLGFAITLLVVAAVIIAPVVIQIFQAGAEFSLAILGEQLLRFGIGAVLVFVFSILYKLGCEKERDVY